MDSLTGQPNSDPDFAASKLSDQYKSVFVKPRPEWVVNDAKEFFAEGGATHALTDIQFSIYDIELACSELKASSAGGADGIKYFEFSLQKKNDIKVSVCQAMTRVGCE